MKVYIKEITAQGIERGGELPPELIGGRDDDQFRFIEPLTFTATLQKFDNTVVAMTHVQGRYSSVCSRCLEPIEKKWVQDFTLDFEVNPLMESIELDEEIRQELILNLPIRFLCSEDCQGLCAGCGVNLNSEKCKCKK